MKPMATRNGFNSYETIKRSEPACAAGVASMGIFLGVIFFVWVTS